MANPLDNLKPWKPGVSPNPGGKPTGARNKLTAAFLNRLCEDFEANGKQAIIDCREQKPDAYIKAIAALLPKELEIKNPLGELDDGQLLAAIAALQSFVSSGGAGKGSPQPSQETTAH